MLRRFIVFQYVLLFGVISAAQNVLPDIILSDTTLSIENSPFHTGDRLEIVEGATLTVGAGVQLIISNGVSIKNTGRFIIRGTKKKPVLFTTELESERWGYIVNSGTIVADHLFIRNAKRFISSTGDTVIVNYCNVSNTYGTIGDDCIGVHDARKVLVTNSIFEGNPLAGKTDALDLDDISNDTVSGNIISHFSDDGVDIGTGSKNIVIRNNIISECDMALSIGENSSAEVSGNLLTYCVGGIQSHFGSIVIAKQNTLYGNLQGLRAFHNVSQETSGGTIHISNSIISSCIDHILFVKDNSELSIDYCLTDSVLMQGTGNITGNPGFADVATANFKLSCNSIAIDAGNPDNDNDGIDYRTDADDTDPDGTRLDLGYLPFYQSSLQIVEISPSNLSLFPDDSGDYSDWFKIYNASDSAINLNRYFLSDKRDNNTKYQLQNNLFIQGGDTVTFRSGSFPALAPDQVPFKLSGEGEYLGISNPDGFLLDEKVFSRIPVDFIYKRKGLTEEWEYSEWPPGDTAKSYIGLCADPIYSNKGGPVSFPVSIALSTDDSGGSLYYSVDGPNPADGVLYEDTLILPEPLTLRSVVKKENYLQTYVHASAYFPEGLYHLPVMSLSTNEENLYGTTGIYTNYNSGGPLWERPASIAYYDSNKQFSIITGIRIQGGNSVWMPKKSFRFHFRGGYGASRLMTSPFSSGPLSFKNIVIRSGYDDDITRTGGSMLRDPFSADLWKKCGELATESSWSILLLNNNYWGIYNVRESINEYFVEDHLGIKEFDLVRFQKWGPDLKKGTWNEWNKLVQYFDTTDFSRPEVYDEIESFMDLNSLLNLLSLVHCTQFRSWTWGAFAVKPVSGKWSWTIWDTDRSYNNLSWNGFTEYANTNAEKWPNFIPQKLIVNERFRNALINRNCDMLNSLFIPGNAISIYDSLVNILTPEMDREFERWNPGNRSNWETNNENVREFLRKRPGYLYGQMKSYFSIDDTVGIEIQIIGNGKVKVNSLLIDQEKWNGVYMKGIPVELEAFPDQGSAFIEWRGLTGKHHVSIDPGEDNTIVAVFDTATVFEREPLVINEIMYNPLLPENSEWIELYNPNDFSVSLEDFTFSDGGFGNQFVIPAGQVIDPDDYLILAGDLINFTVEFGPGKTVLGSFNNGSAGFNLSNGGETITLLNSNAEIEDQVQYGDMAPWPVYADGAGPSLQLIDPEMENNEPYNWFADIKEFYTPGRKNSDYSSVQKVVPEFSIKVYPNPVGEILYISLGSDFHSDINLELYTLAGKQISETVRGAGETISWKHGLRQSGMYILKVSCMEAQDYVEKTSLLIYSGN